MVKSVGSTSHVPVLPVGAAVVMCAVSAISTWAPDVSMLPPLPPLGAEASSVPSTLTLPPSGLPSSLISPPWF